MHLPLTETCVSSFCQFLLLSQPRCKRPGTDFYHAKSGGVCRVNKGSIILLLPIVCLAGGIWENNDRCSLLNTRGDKYFTKCPSQQHNKKGGTSVSQSSNYLLRANSKLWPTGVCLASVTLTFCTVHNEMNPQFRALATPFCPVFYLNLPVLDVSFSCGKRS